MILGLKGLKIMSKYKIKNDLGSYRILEDDIINHGLFAELVDAKLVKSYLEYIDALLLKIEILEAQLKPKHKCPNCNGSGYDYDYSLGAAIPIGECGHCDNGYVDTLEDDFSDVPF